MRFLLEIRTNFRPTRQYTAQTQEINTIYIDLLLTCLVFKKALPTLRSEFKNLPQSITILRNGKSQFKVGLKIFYMYTPFTVWMNFFCMYR